MAPGRRTAKPRPKPTEDAIIAAIATVYDPEIPVNIYELGLIYAIEIARRRRGEGRDDADRAGLPVARRNCPSRCATRS